MKDINSYFAEKCDVITPTITYKNRHDYWWKLGGVVHNRKWDIKRADCREIIREKVHVETFRFGGGWRAENWKAGTIIGEGKGKTIADAEVNCLKAIYNAEKAS